jgi:ABC-type dipeptide/oligopeptide/nickel transport system ATPase component
MVSILSVPDRERSTLIDRMFYSTFIHTWQCKIENNRIPLPNKFIYKNGISILRAYKTNTNNFIEIVLNDDHFEENYKVLKIDILKEHDYAFLIGLRQIDRTAKDNQKSIHKALKANKIPGRHISIILQDPVSFLNPFWSLGRQMKNLTKLHADQAEEDIIENVLSEVKLNTDSFKNAIPRELSGGQGQRAMILLSSLTKPRLLIADEPTTGLDVTLKKIVVEKFQSLRKKRACSMIFISHDLSMVVKATDRINVMYKGEIIENCSSDNFDTIEGHHPYVSKLLGITQSDYVSEAMETQDDMMTIDRGCSYFNLCDLSSKDERCRLIFPPVVSRLKKRILLNEDPDEEWVKCWDYLNE